MGTQISPARGMRDFLPKEKAKRERVIAIIRGFYRARGFTEIETPALEDIDRLTQSEGGENLTMLFKVLRRGLDADTALLPKNAVDLGLRYDLTLPLARYYATNYADLPQPFRAMQIAPVWRAERPQKGRFRQFTQCDIDILGDASVNAEVQLIVATMGAVQALGIEGVSVRLNDRRFLSSLLSSCGFEEKMHACTLIAIDKLDKIGVEGIATELMEKCPDQKAAIDLLVATLIRLERVATENVGDVEALIAALPDGIDFSTVSDIRTIASEVALVDSDIRVRFDPSLVRGMGYYTGPIFELQLDGEGSSIGGGGRYDGMIGKFLEKHVPACGFSIGFERIIGLVPDTILASQKSLLLFYPDDMSISTILRLQQECISHGYETTIAVRPKQVGKAIERAHGDGITSFAFVEHGTATFADLEIKATGERVVISD